MQQEENKILDHSSASYLSLKAELLRKRQDVQTTVPSSSSSTLSSSSSSILDILQSSSSALKLKTKADLDIEVVNPSKKKKKDEPTAVLPPPLPSSTLSREEELAFAKSRAVLEAKSKLYDKMMTDNEMRTLADDDDDDDNDKSFLVDFERKVYETNRHTDDDKVEYTDTFGRTRRVTLEEFQRLTKDQKKTTDEDSRPKKSENEIDRAERLHREQMRAKWQAEMEELRNKTHVHYQDILFDEKREHGVGFYKFSTDEQQRQEEMARLNELRANTKVEQSKIANEKDKRQEMMADRLSRMRQRKAKELGITLPSDDVDLPPPALTETDNKSPPKPSTDIDEMPEQPVTIDRILKQASVTLEEEADNDDEDEQRKKLAAAKKLLFPPAKATSFSEVVDELRNERRQEFCPIYTDESPTEVALRVANQKPVGSLLAKRIRWDELKRQREAEERRAQEQRQYGPYGPIYGHQINQTQSQSFANPYDQYYLNVPNQYGQVLQMNANYRAQQEHSGFWPEQPVPLQNNSQIAQNSTHQQAAPYTYPFPKIRANNIAESNSTFSSAASYFAGTMQPPPPPPDEPYPY